MHNFSALVLDLIVRLMETGLTSREPEFDEGLVVFLFYEVFFYELLFIIIY